MLKQIQPTGYVQWDIYNVVRSAWAPYCGMVIAGSEMKKDDFIKTMQFSSYIRMDGKRAGRDYVITILDRPVSGDGNPISDTTEKFKMFHNSLASEGTVIIIISATPFLTHVVNYINENKLQDTIRRFSYDHFKVVSPLVPWFSSYNILNDTEAEAVIADVYKNKSVIQPILTSDCAMEWCMAEPGQIVQIVRVSPVAGEATVYRRVVKAIL